MIKVFIPAGGLLGWGGGVDFLKYYMGVIGELDNVHLTIGVPVEQWDQRLVRWAKNGIKKMIGRAPYRSHRYGDIFSAYPKVKTAYFRQGGSDRALAAAADLVFLAMKPIPEVDRNKMIGYIPDLQHVHLPQFFSATEIGQREHNFRALMAASGTIFVNSRHTATDLRASYPESAKACTFFSMPFLPLGTHFSTEGCDLSGYRLPKRYFMISSQLWVHKDHPTAFRALAQLVQEAQYADVSILCSGSTYDYRQPDYFAQIEQLIKELGIERNVRFLGFIPKADQLAIMKGAVAVVQPTLFEGGPGGGATYEAVVYGVRSIISDIEINKEIDNPLVAFFEAGNSADLAQKMALALAQDPPAATPTALETQNQLRFAQAKQVLRNFLNHIASTTQTDEHRDEHIGCNDLL